MKTVICISTDPPLANLIPVLHFKSEKILLIATESFKSKASMFRDMVRDMAQNPDGSPGVSVQMITGCHILQYEELGHLPDLLTLWRDKARFK